MTSRALKNTALVAALLTAGVIGGAGVGALNAFHTPSVAATSSAAGGISASAALPDFPQITERYGPAVVNISVSGSTKVSEETASAQGDEDASSGDPFQEFFRRFQQGQGAGKGSRHGAPAGCLICCWAMRSVRKTD